MEREELIEAVAEALKRNDDRRVKVDREKAGGWIFLECGMIIAFTVFFVYLLFWEMPTSDLSDTRMYDSSAEVLADKWETLQEEKAKSVQGYSEEYAMVRLDFWNTLFACLLYFVIAGGWLIARIAFALKHTRKEAYENISMYAIIATLLFAAMQYFRVR